MNDDIENKLPKVLIPMIERKFPEIVSSEIDYLESSTGEYFKSVKNKMIMKYDIIYDQKENRWMMERSDAVYLILRGFLAEFAEQFHRKPKVESLILG